MSELDALLEDETIEDEVTVETEEVDEVETESDETEEEETAETDSSTTEQQTSEEVTDDPEVKNLDWAKVAYLDEKRKRQELEKRLEALESGGKQEQAKGPDLFENPEEYLQQRELRLKADISREMMMEARPDYKEKEDVFLALAKEDPTLVSKLRQAPNPAKFAYDTAVKHKAMEEIGDPVKYREKIKAELLAELQKSAPKKKPSLANTTSVGGGVSSTGDQTLEDILGR